MQDADDLKQLVAARDTADAAAPGAGWLAAGAAIARAAAVTVTTVASGTAPAPVAGHGSHGTRSGHIAGATQLLAVHDHGILSAGPAERIP